MRPKCSCEQSDGCERDENGTNAQPALLPPFREDCLTRLHGATALGDWGPEGGGEPSAKLTASGGYGPILSPLWQDAMPRRGESQYIMSSSEARPPLSGFQLGDSAADRRFPLLRAVPFPSKLHL